MIDSKPQLDQKHREFHELLVTYFDEEELKYLCFCLLIDYDDLRSQGKFHKARELIRYMLRRDRFDELVNEVIKQRPNIQWPSKSVPEPSHKKAMPQSRDEEEKSVNSQSDIEFKSKMPGDTQSPGILPEILISLTYLPKTGLGNAFHVRVVNRNSHPITVENVSLEFFGASAKISYRELSRRNINLTLSLPATIGESESKEFLFPMYDVNTRFGELSLRPVEPASILRTEVLDTYTRTHTYPGGNLEHRQRMFVLRREIVQQSQINDPVLTDAQLRNIILKLYYDQRKQLKPVSLKTLGFDVAITQNDIFRISQQLHKKNLIEFKPLLGDDTIVAGMGIITDLGIACIESAQNN